MSLGYSKVFYAAALIAVLTLAIIVSGCSGGNPAGDNTGGSSAPTAAVHGTISTGAVVKETTMGITPAGGKVTVNKPESPINGLSIEVPAGALTNARTFEVSSAPVTGHTFGQYFTPASPLITIDNGGGYANDYMTVRIPVNASPSDFVMAFYYDAANQTLEGLPTVDRDSTSITIATLHFCDVVLSKIDRSLLDTVSVADSGFKPGRDDFEFTNNGSYAAPKGQCAGQSLAMMWYYVNKRQKENAPSLFGLYDDNGREKTPKVNGDDVLAYRFASVVHTDMRWTEYYAPRIQTEIKNKSAVEQFDAFKYAILMTRQPQAVYLTGSMGAHAIVCYAVDGNTLHVADPNYPGQARTIRLNGTKFDPYPTGANANEIATQGASYFDGIYYMADTALVPMYSIPARWEQFKAGTIGDSLFPQYNILLNIYAPGNSKPVRTMRILGGLNEETIKIPTNGTSVDIHMSRLEGSTVSWAMSLVQLYNGDVPIEGNTVNLTSGKNLIGVEALVNGVWIGFNWFEFDSQPGATPTPTPGPSNERKPDRSVHEVTVPVAPAAIQMKVINNSDGSSQTYAYYKDNNGREVTWGSLKTFYSDGKLKSESTRLDAKTIGYSRSYGSDGKLTYEQYRDSDGVLQYQDYYSTTTGKLRQAIDYWPNGKEKDRYEYGDDGGPLKTYYEYDSSGTLKLKETWSNGKLIDSKKY